MARCASCGESKGRDDPLGREIDKRIISDLKAETADAFELNEVSGYVMALERFFVDQFYLNKEIRDNCIYDALAKIYALQKGIIPVLEKENRVDELIFKKFNEIDKRFSNLSDELKARAILRIIKSIRSSSGGTLGNRNYLEMIYSQHTGKGKWADLLGKLESGSHQ